MQFAITKVYHSSGIPELGCTTLLYYCFNEFRLQHFIIFSYLIIISFSVFLFFHFRRSHAELALPDLVTKFTSTPAKTAKLPPPSHHPDPTTTVDMEFLIPQLPVSANGRTNLLIKGGGGGVSSSSSSTSTSSSFASSGKARSKNATNGSILQSALNSLNSRQSGVNVAVIQAHQNNPRFSQPTSYNHSTSADSIVTPSMRPHAYHKQTSVSHISAAMSTMLLQQQTSVSLHSTSSTSSLASTTSLPPTSSSTAGAATAATMMPPPPLVQPHSTKMTKKQLKLAQAQLDKLTQINIHLHGMSVCFIYC